MKNCIYVTKSYRDPDRFVSCFVGIVICYLTDVIRTDSRRDRGLIVVLTKVVLFKAW